MKVLFGFVTTFLKFSSLKYKVLKELKDLNILIFYS